MYCTTTKLKLRLRSFVAPTNQLETIVIYNPTWFSFGNLLFSHSSVHQKFNIKKHFRSLEERQYKRYTFIKFMKFVCLQNRQIHRPKKYKSDHLKQCYCHNFTISSVIIIKLWTLLCLIHHHQLPRPKKTLHHHHTDYSTSLPSTVTSQSDKPVVLSRRSLKYHQYDKPPTNHTEKIESLIIFISLSLSLFTSILPKF